MPLPSSLTDPTQLGFDPKALIERYRVERDKRLREDDEAQFIAIKSKGEYSHYLTDDPYAPPLTPREPIDDEVEFLIIGGGWAGLMMAAQLKKAGIGDVRIVEAAADFGGTWYWNRYPGAQCDVQSYIYMPLLEETGYIPKERYTFAPELYEHARRIGKHFDLYSGALFQTWVNDLRWDEKALRWIVTTNRNDAMRARSVAVATGVASRPRLPGIPGIETFEGHSFHTSRWDYDYTGGGAAGDLTGLADKRVGLIGTGATAIQCLPHIAASAQQTYVFQRTPSAVLDRQNRPTDPDWIKTLEPGWQRRMGDAFDNVVAGAEIDGEMITGEPMLRTFFHIHSLMRQVDMSKLTADEQAQLVELGGFIAGEEVRARVDATVRDPEVAEKLKHWYYPTCKRPTFNDDYIKAFNRPNVTLVDVSETKGIERITKKGIVANGVEYEVDCIVYASGFEMTSAFENRLGIPIYGMGGESIYDHWTDGMRTMFGVMVGGFPNLFLVGGLFNFTLSANYTGTLNDQTAALARLVRILKDRGVAAYPSREGEEAWIEEQLSAPPTLVSSLLGGGPEKCTPGYYNQEGKAADKKRDHRRESYSPGGVAYTQRFKTWIESDLPGLETIAT